MQNYKKIVFCFAGSKRPPKKNMSSSKNFSLLKPRKAGRKTLNDHPEKVTPPFLELLNGVISQAESQEQEQPEELKARLQAIYRRRFADIDEKQSE